MSNTKVTVSIAMEGTDSIIKKLEKIKELAVETKALIREVEGEIEDMAPTFSFTQENASAEDKITICNDK